MAASSKAASRGVGGGGLAVLLLLLSGCRDEDVPEEDDDEPMSLATTGGAGGDGSTGAAVEPSADASDLCERAPVIGPARHQGTLRNRGAELGGACGLGGPDVFFRLDVPRRSDVWLQAYGVGFSPRVGVLPHACTTDWAHRTLLCNEGVGAWLLDVAAGSSLVVSVGVDDEHPVLDQAPSLEGPDPLGFALDVVLRNVLEVGEPCLPAGVGRCGSGTACLPAPPPADEPAEASPGPAVCTVLEGDTCQTAVAVPVATGVTVVEIDPTVHHTDAHAHSCGGARRRERVLRLGLPGPGAHAVEIRVDHPDVGLALRAPGCLVEDERGCVEPGAAMLAVEVRGPEAFLFVELPLAEDGAGDGSSSTGRAGDDEPGEEAPIVVAVQRSDPTPEPP
jgi:hypothetical protein